MKSVTPTNGMKVTESTKLNPGTYFLPNGIQIVGNDLTLDLHGVELLGFKDNHCAISVINSKNVKVIGANIRSFYHGIRIENSEEVTISDSDISDTHELASNSIFLDIWKKPNDSYGSGIFVNNSNSITIKNCKLMHQQNGILIYNSQQAKLMFNECSYNSGSGIVLYNTSNSHFENNHCDYCCRFQPREGKLHHGHMGADAAGFLAIAGSSNNIFYRNTARMGGDGFFLAGFGPERIKAGCNNNRFIENDASWSPNIGFEATFCSGNHFEGNIANNCNYGFWCGFSTQTTIENNTICKNREAGIAVENGSNFTVRNNCFSENKHGVLLWNHPLESLQSDWPEKDTSKHWLIEQNQFDSNKVGIRIAANQSHGTRPIDKSEKTLPQPVPHSHKIINNEFTNQIIAIELVNTHDNQIIDNRFSGSILKDLLERT